MGSRTPRRAAVALALRGLLAVALALLLAPPPLAAAPVDRRLVEAAFVLNFLRYADWPGEPDAGGELRVLVIGPVEAARALRSIAADAQPLDGRRVRVRHLAADAGNLPGTDRLVGLLDRAHAVFVAESGHPLTAAVVDLASRRPVLTIGVGVAFAHAGGMLALVEDQDHLAFTCNEAAVLRSPVMVSTKVLRIARPLQPSSSLDLLPVRVLALLGRPGIPAA